MTSILSIDTSTDACSVALSIPSGIYQSITISPREHTQRLLPMIEALLAEHQCSISQLDAIAFGVGPGSFTGLRIAISVAQGLAYGADLPLIPVSTLAAMAQTACRSRGLFDGSDTSASLVVPVIDARMNEVYWSTYQIGDEGRVIEVDGESMSHPQAAVNITEGNWGTSQMIGVGSGWRYDELSQRFQGASIDAELYPEAYDIAVLGKALYAQGKTVDPIDARPTYIRDEVSWKKRQKIRQQSH